jgi:hypothetical protein
VVAAVVERSPAAPVGRAASVRRDEQIQAVRQAQRTAPQLDAVAEERERKARRDRLPDDRQVRTWYCRSCGICERTATIPAGLYSVTRYSGALEHKPARLEVYCSAECLNAQMPLLIGVEAGAGERWAVGLERRS